MSPSSWKSNQGIGGRPIKYCYQNWLNFWISFRKVWKRGFNENLLCAQKDQKLNLIKVKSLMKAHLSNFAFAWSRNEMRIQKMPNHVGLEKVYFYRRNTRGWWIFVTTGYDVFKFGTSRAASKINPTALRRWNCPVLLIISLHFSGSSIVLI